jgi:hypothetical protein
LKNVQFGQERCMHKVLDKEGMVVEEIRATWQMPHVLYSDNKKNTVGICQAPHGKLLKVKKK